MSAGNAVVDVELVLSANGAGKVCATTLIAP